MLAAGLGAWGVLVALTWPASSSTAAAVVQALLVDAVVALATVALVRPAVAEVLEARSQMLPVRQRGDVHARARVCGLLIPPSPLSVRAHYAPAVVSRLPLVPLGVGHLRRDRLSELAPGARLRPDCGGGGGGGGGPRHDGGAGILGRGRRGGGVSRLEPKWLRGRP